MHISDNENVSNKNDNRKYLPFTEHEALALLIDAQLSKSQYNLITQRLKEKEINILPSYAQIIKAKKECYPCHTEVTESGARVKLQSLLDHTSERLLKSLDKSNLPQESESVLMLTSKYGCDGTSGFSMYKQKFIDSNCTDESIFMVSMVPIFLSVVHENHINQSIWENSKPNSTRLCRPLKFQFVKETKQKNFVRNE